MIVMSLTMGSNTLNICDLVPHTLWYVILGAGCCSLLTCCVAAMRGILSWAFL